ncbi:uncharacterized protein LOC103570535 [Microplitis demolitor]|uniref:uncharacterized protein LOC103570535 n=1 Tax=Microplitis demolitor TaxID=69319 RepID=UPI0004CD17DF|nr:uncharacterized protein LOC103570535 [Microplitis demolitor]
MVERFHRQLKAAIRCHHSRWTEALPVVLLGIRSAWKEDSDATAAEMLYGQPLRLIGKFLTYRASEPDDVNTAMFVKELRHRFQDLQPAHINRHGDKRVFVFKDLATAEHVFILHDGPKKPLQHPYEGPYRVVSKSEKSFVVNVREKDITVSIDRLKPAYTLSNTIDEPEHDPEDDRGTIGALPPPHALPEPPAAPDEPRPLRIPEVPAAVNPPLALETLRQTRSGRRVRFSDRFQAGFS